MLTNFIIYLFIINPQLLKCLITFTYYNMYICVDTIKKKLIYVLTVWYLYNLIGIFLFLGQICIFNMLCVTLLFIMHHTL